MKTRNTENTIQLTPEQQYMVDQVMASLAIENMYPDEECMTAIKRIAAGEITAEEAIDIHRRNNQL